MLNRMINGAAEPETRQHFIEVLARAEKNPLADPETLQRVRELLKWQQSK
jgi:hypothetical protein